jgi:hypothetical protein
MHLGGKWKSPFRINVRYARYPGTFRRQKHERLPHLLQCWRRPLSSGCLLNCHRTISSMPGPAKGSAANEIFYSTIFPPGGGCEKCRAGLVALAGRRVDGLEQPKIERNMIHVGGPVRQDRRKWQNARHSGAVQRNPESRVSVFQQKRAAHPNGCQTAGPTPRFWIPGSAARPRNDENVPAFCQNEKGRHRCRPFVCVA